MSESIAGEPEDARTPAQSAEAAHAPTRSSAPRVNAARVLAEWPETELSELHAFWSGRREREEHLGAAVHREQILAHMLEPATAEARVLGLGKRLCGVFEQLLRAPHYQLPYDELAAAPSLSYLSAADLESSLAALKRRALLVEPGELARAPRRLCVPPEVGDAVLRQRRARERGIFDLVTLRGHLDRLYSDPARAQSSSPGRVRELYKLYSREAACVARVERLPEGLRDLVGKVVLEFGGVLPRELFERLQTELPHWNGKRWQMLLERSLVGTVAPLSLARYGILHADETLIVFNEVALAWLRKVAVPGDPDHPHDESSLSVDQISNLSRFMSFIQENDVRFTLRGEIFKTSEKRLLSQLIPNPGRELSREAILSFLYDFARHSGLIDRTGERTLAASSRGREWDQLELREKLRALLEYALDDRSLGGEHFHQVRMRQILLRLLKRVEPQTWYDLMYLPFLARNNYLASLDELHVEDDFAERGQSAQIAPMEDLQRLAWNLVRWVRQRLFLLGIVDLGYDKAGRPVAMRLTRAGARLLEVSIDAHTGERGVGTLVVTPDFEVVLFPTGDDAELVHDLDRFCVRSKQGALLHFTITEASVRRALTAGMYLARILHVLDAHARTPLPQNVRFSIQDWARRAGLMSMNAELVLRCEDPEVLRRFQQDPGARVHIRQVLGEGALALKGRYSARRMQSLLRELGYLVELT